MKNVLIICVLAIFLASCNEREIPIVTTDVAYLSFTKDPSKDSTTYSFVAYPDGVITTDVIIELRGHFLTEPREFSLSVDEERSTFPAEYVIFPDKCEFGAGQATDTVQVQFVNYDELGEQTLRLFLKINESEKVKEGDEAFRRAYYVLSDKIAKPLWWQELNVGYGGNLTYNLAEKSYLGLYSDKKYSMFLEELAKDGVVFDGKDVSVLRKYSLRLKYRIEEFNNDPANIAAGLVPLWDEENNEAMSVPVKG